MGPWVRVMWQLLCHSKRLKRTGKGSAGPPACTPTEEPAPYQHQVGQDGSFTVCNT